MPNLLTLWTQLWNSGKSAIRGAATASSPATTVSAPPAPVPLSAPIDDEQQYQAILEDQTELICRYLADTTILYVNPAYCRYFGVSQAEITNRSYQPVIHADDRDAVAQQVAKMTCAQPQVTIENRVVVQGEVRWTQWHNRCLCSPAGDIVAYQSVGRDITALKLAEQALRDSEERYRSLVEAIPQLIWVTDADGFSNLDFNQRWYTFTGQSPTTHVGTGLFAVVHPHDISAVLFQWRQSLATGQDYEAELRLRRADGVYVWHLAKAQPTYDDNHKIRRWYGTCTDISERKAIELKQKETEQALKNLNNTLEKRILDRTAELVHTNHNLHREIVERQQAELQLKESEERFRRAVVEAPVPIFIHGEDGRILQMSQTVYEITQYSQAEVGSISDWTQRAYGDRQISVLEKINRLYDLDRRLDEGEFEVKAKTGETRIWLFSSAPLGQLADGTRLVISMAADVTQQKRIEADLATRLNQQAVIAHLSQTALSTPHLPSLFDLATRLLAESLGVTLSHILVLQPDQRSLQFEAGWGWPVGLVGQAEISAAPDTFAGYTLHTRQPVIMSDRATESRFGDNSLLADQGIKSGIGTIIPGHQAQPFGIIAAYATEPRSFTEDDINFLQVLANLLGTAITRTDTEAALQALNLNLEERIRQRTQDLEAANHELEAFSYSVAHDLRAPLRSIQGFAKVLEEDYCTVLDTAGQDYIRRMAMSAESLDILIQDLLAYSHLGRADITLRSVDAQTLVRQVLTHLGPQLSATQARVSFATALPTVYAQRSILRQVFINLLGNAMKFVAQGVQPDISIGATPVPSRAPSDSPDQTWVRLWVQDNGIGIDPRHQQRIFCPFERLHGADIYPGTGIGLSIVQRGVNRMGGRVGVQSAQQQGSYFWIELPGHMPPSNDTAI